MNTSMQAHPIHNSRMDEQPDSRQNLDQRNNVRLKESFNDWVTAFSLRKIFNFSPNKWSKTGQTSKPFSGFSQQLWLEKGPPKTDTKIKLGFYWEQSPNHNLRNASTISTSQPWKFILFFLFMRSNNVIYYWLGKTILTFD